MKKFLTVFFATMLLSGVIATAQTRSWSVNAGYLSSALSVSAGALSASLDLNGFFVGVACDLPTSSAESTIQIGANWDIKSASLGDESATVHYLRVPVFTKYTHPVNDGMALFFGAGPSFNFGIYGGDDAFASEDGGLYRFHLQLGAAVGMVFSDKFIVKIGYDYGLTKAMRADVSNRINALQIGVGLKF